MCKEDYIDFITGLEGDCDYYAQDIISRLCKRAIKVMNKQDAYLAGSTDYYPPTFTFYDILSIELQEKCYEEINPYLQDFVETSLDNEYEKLPALERFVLDHCVHDEHLKCDTRAIEGKIYDSFHAMLNEHYETRKIQDYLIRS